MEGTRSGCLLDAAVRKQRERRGGEVFGHLNASDIQFLVLLPSGGRPGVPSQDAGHAKANG